MLHFCLAIIFAAVIHSYANECEYNGIYYGVGENTTDQCWIFQCSADGSWTDKGQNSSCVLCLFGKPSSAEHSVYFNIFDNNDGYIVNANACSYSLAQKYESGSSVEETYDPYPAVFASLRSCGKNNTKFCFDFVTTRVNPDVQITFSPALPTEILVNDVSMTLPEQAETLSLNGNKIPVIVYAPKGRTFFMLPDFLIIIMGVGYTLVSVTPNLQGELAGICGYFDGNSQNDFLLRNGTTVDADLHADAFLDSWLTKEQDKCESPVPEKEETSCIDSEEVAQTCISLLASVPNLHTFIGICTSLLCNDPENGQLIIQAALKTPSLMFKLLTVV